ncbi:surface-adhesin E family protein [Paraburkholderia guartelaensis]|uniref:surface-adhesin E family protein n=1 Tax=Paraburkholderia guartelaensis TaxID=2546446 RepID=UPI002AB5EB44|nr:surface-adhesin E family protein [Paraburkholderia guartelaensis]
MESRKICAALIAAMALVSVSAQAEWIQLDGGVTINNEHILKKGPLRSVYIRDANGGNTGAGHYAYAVMRSIYDCNAWTTAAQSITLYSINGAVVYSNEWKSYQQSYSSIMPGSNGEIIAKAVCAMN